MNASTITRILLSSAALSCGALAQEKTTTVPPPVTTAKGAAEAVRSLMISEFQCNEEPLDALLSRLSKLSGVGIKLNKDSFKGKAVPAVTVPALKGFRLEDLLNTMTSASATKWAVTSSFVEVSTQ